MNQQQRTRIEKLIDRLQDLKTDIELIRDEEQGKVDNTPDNLQDSDQAKKLVECAENLDSAADECDTIIQSLQSAIE